MIAAISKPAHWDVVPNLLDYEEERARFTWNAARAALDGLPGGAGLNVAHETVDRHAAGSRAGHVALRWRGRHGERRNITYAELTTLTNRFANVLVELGVDPEDRVFLLAGRIPDLYVAALGGLKARAVVSPLFSACGPEPIRQRLAIGAGRVLVTTTALYARKVAPIRQQLPALKHVILVDGAADAPGTPALPALMGRAADNFTIGPTDSEHPALLHFTSGTTGTPGLDFAEQLDIDSMDQLNFVIGLHEATGLDIPERDYPRMASLDACVEYLRTAATG